LFTFSRPLLKPLKALFHAMRVDVKFRDQRVTNVADQAIFTRFVAAFHLQVDDELVDTLTRER
jgi:hypothetical protein